MDSASPAYPGQEPNPFSEFKCADMRQTILERGRHSFVWKRQIGCLSSVEPSHLTKLLGQSCGNFCIFADEESFAHVLGAGRNGKPGEARVRISLNRSTLEGSYLVADVYNKN